MPATPAAPIDRARQERFARQLAPSPWDATVDDGDEAGAWPALAGDAGHAVDAIDDDGSGGSAGHEGNEPQDGDASAEPPSQPTLPTPPDTPPWQPPARPAQAHAANGHAHDGGEGAQRGHGAAMPVQAASSGDDTPPWLNDVAQQVARLCTEGDPRFQYWSVTLPLDPAVLPECELQLNLSPGAMTLRFRTGSAQSAALVCKHRDSLLARLEALPSSPPAIDIDLE